MSQTLTVDLPDEVYELLRRSAEVEHRSPEDIAADLLAASVRSREEDPVLQLLGTVESEVTDVAARHDEYIGRSIAGELRRQNDA
jgi:plasmid stability protein